MIVADPAVWMYRLKSENVFTFILTSKWGAKFVTVVNILQTNSWKLPFDLAKNLMGEACYPHRDPWQCKVWYFDIFFIIFASMERVETV